MKTDKFVSIVLYLNNSEKYIPSFLENVAKPLCEKFKHLELVCVDDESTDKAISLVEEWTKRQSDNVVTNIVYMSNYQGIENAMNAGRDFAIGDFVFEFDDAFCDYDTDVLFKMYDLVSSGYDIVSAGVGLCSGTSKMYYKLYNATSRTNTKIGPETCRILSRRAINRIKNLGQHIPYRKAVYNSCGLKSCVISYESSDIKERKKLRKSTGERFGLAMDSFIYFTDFLERLSIILSGLFLLFTLVMGVYVLCNQFFEIRPVEGWMSTMLFLSLGFFGVFLLLTIVLKYLSTLVNLVFKQSHYVIEKVEKVNINE